MRPPIEARPVCTIAWATVYTQLVTRTDRVASVGRLRLGQTPPSCIVLYSNHVGRAHVTRWKPSLLIERYDSPENPIFISLPSACASTGFSQCTPERVTVFATSCILHWCTCTLDFRGKSITFKKGENRRRLNRKRRKVAEDRGCRVKVL